MKLGFSPEEELFRKECADWLNGQMAGEFRDIKGITKLTGRPERRKEWEQQLAAHRWSCIGWPSRWGGRNATLAQQVIFAEEYARAGVPGRVNHIGIELAGPTILTFGTEEQKQRFLPGIAGAGHLSMAQHGGPVADALHLLQPVADIEHRAAFRLQLHQRLEQPVGFLRRQHRSRLVQNDQPGIL